MNLKTPALLLSMLLLPTAGVHAGSLLDFDHSASALGVANAFVADSSDASAMFFNPAGIAWQPGVRVMMGGSITNRSSSVELSDGVSHSNAGNDATRYAFAMSWQPHDRDWGFGIAYSIPHQAENIWREDVFSGEALVTRLHAQRLSADVIYAVNSDMALAVGIDGYYTTFDFDRATTTFSGTDNISAGAHVSLKWNPTFNWSLGAIYRTGTSVDFTADSGAGSMQFYLPSEIRFGVGYRALDGIRLEVDGIWVKNSKAPALGVAGGALPATESAAFKDQYAVMLGMTWSWREHSQFRFGYGVESEISSDEAFTAYFPNAITHRFTLGAGGELYGVHIDLGYAYSHSESRGVIGSAGFDGRYRGTHHQFLFSGSKPF